MRIPHNLAFTMLVALTTSILSAGSIPFTVTTTIPLQDVNALFIDCGVPIASCNASSFQALIIDDNEAG